MESTASGLSGLKEIAAYLRRSPATIMKMIQSEGMPAKKILGVWESDKTLIDEWRRKKIQACGKTKK